MKQRTNLRMILIFCIMVLAILLIGSTRVDAVEITDEAWNSIPNEMSVDVKESEYRNSYDIIKNQVIETLKQNGVTVDVKEVMVSYDTLSVNIPNYWMDDIHKANVFIGNKSKKINITYSNSAEFSESELQKVRNIVKGINMDPIVVELNDNISYDPIEGMVEPLIKAGYTLDNIGGSGGGGDLVFSFAGMARLDIFKNDIHYGAIDCNVATQSKLTIPSTIENTETAIINYANPILEKYIENNRAEDGSIGETTYNTGDGIIIKKYEDNYYRVSNAKTQELIGTIILQRATSTNTDNTGNTGNTGNTETKPITKEDKTTGIKLIGTFADTIVLDVEEVKNQKIPSEWSLAKWTVYDINLLKDGAKVQPNGKVKVSIPIPDSFDKTSKTTRLVVWRVEKDGAFNTSKKYDVTIEGNYATFETDHFSIYVLGETKIANTGDTTSTKPNTSTSNSNKLDDTPKTGVNNVILVSSAIVSIISLAGIILIKRK